MYALHDEAYGTTASPGNQSRVADHLAELERVLAGRQRLDSEIQKALSTLWSVEQQRETATHQELVPPALAHSGGVTKETEPVPTPTVKGPSGMLAAAPCAGLREALDRITRSESVPPLDAFLELGRELHAARLDYFIRGAFPSRTDPAMSALHLTSTACRFHEMPDDQARLKDDEHVADLLAQVAQRPGFWLYVRDELLTFTRLVEEELRKRHPPPLPESVSQQATTPEQDGIGESNRRTARLVWPFPQPPQDLIEAAARDVPCVLCDVPEVERHGVNVLTLIGELREKSRRLEAAAAWGICWLVQQGHLQAGHFTPSPDGRRRIQWTTQQGPTQAERCDPGPMLQEPEDWLVRPLPSLWAWWRRPNANPTDSQTSAPANDNDTDQNRKGKRINERILGKLQQYPDSLYWSAQQWADALGCSKSTIAETPTWKTTIRAARAMQQAERETRQGRSQGRSDDD